MINLHILKMQIFHELPWQPFFKNPCNFVKKKRTEKYLHTVTVFVSFRNMIVFFGPVLNEKFLNIFFI